MVGNLLILNEFLDFMDFTYGTLSPSVCYLTSGTCSLRGSACCVLLTFFPFKISLILSTTLSVCLLLTGVSV